MIPVPTPQQAVHVLEILDQWTKRGWRYEVDSYPPSQVIVYYTDPESGFVWQGGPSAAGSLDASGMNHFDALCQATTVMQMLLEEYPEKP
jgi:hypothetical protein